MRRGWVSNVKSALLSAAALAAAAFGGSAQAAVIHFDGDGGPLHDNLTFSSTISVASGLSMSDVDISLAYLQHQRWADLDIVVVHDGVTVWLTNTNGGSSDADGHYTFDDEAATDVGLIANGAGAYTPYQALSAFDGMSAAGDWTLHVTDTGTRNFGQFHNWTLSVTGAAVPEPATWGMMILGFFGLGAMARASRRKPARALG